MSMYNLKPHEVCPVCTCKIGFHSNRGQTNQATAVVTKGNDGSKSVLPQWGTGEYKTVKPFIEKFERVLTGDLVNKSHWPRLLLKATPNNHDGYWVNKYIVEENKSWEDAKKLFAEHFESYSYKHGLIKEYQRIKQFNGETAQRFTDRFFQCVEQLGYKDEDPLVIQHYLSALLSETSANLLRHLESAALASGEPVTYTSLKKVSDIVLRLEAIELNYGVKSLSISHRNNGNHNSGSSNTHSNFNNNSGASDKTSTKRCQYHPGSSSHTTAECSQNPNKRDTSQSNGGNTPSVAHTNKKQRWPSSQKRCYLCHDLNHLADTCPKRSGVHSHNAERSGNIPSGATNMAGTRPVTINGSSVSAPSSSSTSASTSTSTSASSSSSASSLTSSRPTATNRSAVLTDTHDTVDRTLPEQVFSFDHHRTIMIAVNGCIYNTNIDTGASISFIDTALATKLGLSITTPTTPGHVLLAHAGTSIPRVGTVMVNSTVFFPGTDKPSVQLEYKFELMPLYSKDADYHFTIGKDLIYRFFPDALPHNYYLPTTDDSDQQQLRSATLRVETSQTGDPSLDQPSVVTVETATELESQFKVERTKLLDTLAPLLAVNSSLTGFCNVPESMVTLSIKAEYESKLYRRQYPVAQSLIEPITKIIDRWFHEGKTMDAPPGCKYNNPITPALKRDDNGNVIGVRPCLDVRALNEALMVGDRFIIPHIRESLESSAGNGIFSEFDLAEAYLQMLLHPDSRPYTAFTWGRRQYMFVGCPYGLTLLTSHFQRIMTRIFSDLPFCSPYVDNIPFASKDWDTIQHTLELL
ncbi:MAG TPA: reverse transcriptase domain-containing protein [Candidatus Babeliaceae bacterium]|nr:reverse transcriptase domain-containing protein [Candidatus Babeliaceae bacterium]